MFAMKTEEAITRVWAGQKQQQKMQGSHGPSMATQTFPGAWRPTKERHISRKRRALAGATRTYIQIRARPPGWLGTWGQITSASPPVTRAL